MRTLARLTIAAVLLCGLAFIPGASPASADVYAQCDTLQHRIPGDIRATVTNGYLDASVIAVHPGTGWNQNSFAVAWRGMDGVSYTTYMRLYGGVTWANYWWRMESPPGYIPGMSYGHSPGWNVTPESTYSLTLWNWGSDNMRWRSTDYNYSWSQWYWDAPINGSTWTSSFPLRNYSSWFDGGLKLNLFQGAYAGNGGYYVDYTCGYGGSRTINDFRQHA